MGEGGHLTGGESTIHPRFIDVLKLAKKSPLNANQCVNHRYDAQAAPVAKLSALPRRSPIFHPRPRREHDALTEGSSEQVTAAMRWRRRTQARWGHS